MAHGKGIPAAAVLAGASGNSGVQPCSDESWAEWQAFQRAHGGKGHWSQLEAWRASQQAAQHIGDNIAQRSLQDQIDAAGDCADWDTYDRLRAEQKAIERANIAKQDAQRALTAGRFQEIRRQLSRLRAEDLAGLTVAQRFADLLSVPTPRRDAYWDSLSRDEQEAYLATLKAENMADGGDWV